MSNLNDLSTLILIFGILAFVVSAIVEVIKELPFLKKTPTQLIVIITSLIVVPVTMFGMAAYFKTVIEWYMIFASFIAALIIAFIAMYGWERLTELAERMIKR